jgi:acyl-CoA ligase (AMP-forming) (exosortase A-associated)
MPTFVHELISNTAQKRPHALALQVKDQNISYQNLVNNITSVANAYLSLKINKEDRIGIYLAKTIENIEAMFACSLAAAAFVPINPVLKAKQVQHIVNDCHIKLLVTNSSRLKSLESSIEKLPSIKHIILTDEIIGNETQKNDLKAYLSSHSIALHSFADLKSRQHVTTTVTSNTKDTDLAAILYTSGSTGKPKGIMLSHKNIVLGAKSVSQYLENTPADKLLAVLPLSFDYGLSQLTTSFLTGGTCVLLDYLFANDVLKAIEKYSITGLAGVPPLWAQLSKVKWSDYSTQSLRYFTNSGGALSPSTTQKIRGYMPQAKPYLMYGLTEAFRSTYLLPNEVDNKVGSIGKAIPNAEVLVLRPDDTECEVGEVGELVHIGPLVSMGYWQNSEATALRFKATPKSAMNTDNCPIAVYSGDFAKRDKEGFLYFIARQDEMIKTSGYRVSPSEIEEVVLQHPLVDEVVIIGDAHPDLGQSILCIVAIDVPRKFTDSDNEKEIKNIKLTLSKHCTLLLANYMVPKSFILLPELPKNPNGKLDRNQLKQRYQHSTQ